MYHVLQTLGRFAGYYNVSYKIGDKIYRNKSSVSQVLREHFGEDCEVTILVPESLVTILADDIDEAFNLLRNKYKFEKCAKDRIIETELLEEPFNVLTIQSVGLYKKGSWHIYFKNHIDNIVCYTFLDLLKRFNNINCKLLVDISTGQNLYVNSMVEAIRALIVYNKLCYILQEKTNLSIDIVSVPPILKEVMEYDVGFYKYDVKAFFEFPIKEKIPTSATNFLYKTSSDLKHKIGLKLKKTSNILNRILKSAKLSFNAVKYNVPLSMFYNDIINLDFGFPIMPFGSLGQCHYLG